ncbi:MAG: uroporphyrinogen decarboxylase [Haliscomenobacteraceae bacterium CHB4]|nr:uroporphyrinogen decarboxylase [Haliscomenobacteraceae bacterium CHB4]
MHSPNPQSAIRNPQSPIPDPHSPAPLFLRAANGEATERPPVWLMRQAGRILPQYRALRSKFPDFKAFVKTPEAAAEATIQPVDELGVDAAIIFSDILVVPEAMGLDYEMVEAKGPRFPKVIENQNDVAGLISGVMAAERLAYVYEALRITKRELAGRVPLLGFAGAPWTILAYMVEGSGSKTFSKARRMLYAEPELAHALLQKITDTTIQYLKNQVTAGADLVQIFDSWAGELPPEHYRVFAVPYLGQICEALPEVPKTIFAKGAWFALEDLANLPCQVLGLDWNITPEFGKKSSGGRKVLQGNLDPCALYADTKSIEKETFAMIRAFGGHHIANLGHGVYPDTPLDGVRAFVEAVKSFRWEL